jgi:hypothetical protein
MNIKQLNRNKFQKYIRPLFIKDKCDICENTQGLELHHYIQFDKLFRNAIDKLGYKYEEEIEKYTTEQLELISLVLLGLQIKCKYYTLCDKCHQNMHEDGGRSIYDHINKRNKDKLINNKIKSVLIPYLESILNEKLYDDEKEQLKNTFIRCDISFRTMGINSLNKLLLKYNIPYIIIAKRNKDERWWVVYRNS